ncbi:MAG: hypothetical protein ACM3WU_12650 [Bacillota bacterium]
MSRSESKTEYPWLSRISRGWKAYQKSFSAGRQHAREALELFASAAESLRAEGDTENLPLALDGMGASLHLLGSLDDLRRAVKCYDEEVRLLRKARNPQELAQAVSSQQTVLRDLAIVDPVSAFTYLEKGLRLGETGMTLAAKARDERSLAWVSQTTADLCCVLASVDKPCRAAHLETAMDLYHKAAALWDRVGSGRKPREVIEGKSLAMLGLAEAHILLGKDLSEARLLLDKVKESYAKPGAGAYQLAHLESLYGSLALAEGDKEEAKRRFEAAGRSFRDLGFGDDGSGDCGSENHWK